MAIPRAPARLCSAIVAASLTFAPTASAQVPLALAAPADVSPSGAQLARSPVQESARLQIASGDALGAAMQLDSAANQSGDPVLFLDAADAYYAAAESSRDPSSLDLGRERVKVALDILYFLRDPAADSAWQPVGMAEVGTQIARANDYLRRASELQEQLISEAAIAEVSAEDDPPAPGRTLVIAGAAVTALGVAGLGVGVAGLFLGNQQQKKADDPTIYGDALDPVDKKGKAANALAWGGLIGGGVLTAAGVVLIVLGLKKKKEAGGGAMAGVQVFPTLGGLGVRGRF